MKTLDELIAEESAAWKEYQTLIYKRDEVLKAAEDRWNTLFHLRMDEQKRLEVEKLRAEIRAELEAEKEGK